MEHEFGSLEVGKRADLLVLNEDPSRCAEETIKDIRVDATLIDGKLVHGAL